MKKKNVYRGTLEEAMFYIGLLKNLRSMLDAKLHYALHVAKDRRR